MAKKTIVAKSKRVSKRKTVKSKRKVVKSKRVSKRKAAKSKRKAAKSKRKAKSRKTVKSKRVSKRKAVKSKRKTVKSKRVSKRKSNKYRLEHVLQKDPGIDILKTLSDVQLIRMLKASPQLKKIIDKISKPRVEELRRMGGWEPLKPDFKHWTDALERHAIVGIDDDPTIQSAIYPTIQSAIDSMMLSNPQNNSPFNIWVRRKEGNGDIKENVHIKWVKDKDTKDITVDIRADTSKGKLEWINRPPPEAASIVKMKQERDKIESMLEDLIEERGELEETLAEKRLQTNDIQQLQILTTKIANKQATLSIIEQQLRVLEHAADPITLEVSGNITVRVDGFKITSRTGAGKGTGIKTSNDSSIYLNNVDVFRCGSTGIKIGSFLKTNHQMIEQGEGGRQEGWEKNPWTRRPEGANAYLENCTSNDNFRDGLYVALGSTVRLTTFEAMNNSKYDINCQGQVMLFGKLTSRTLFMEFTEPGSRIERWDEGRGEVTKAPFGISKIDVPIKDKPRYFKQIDIVPEAYMDVHKKILDIYTKVGNSCIVELIREGNTGGGSRGDTPEKTTIEVSATSEEAVRDAVAIIKKIEKAKNEKFGDKYDK